MLGLKMRKVTFENEYTLTELFKEIEGVEFEAGKPKMSKNTFGPAIVFPPIDENNQVAIQAYDYRGDSVGCVFRVLKQEQGGVDMSLWDDDTYSSGGFSGIFGKKKKMTVKLVDSVADQLESMGL